MYLQQFIKLVNCFHLHLQVAFDHFYDTTASCDKCTLYADRNCVNRRNVTCEVDKNFSACKQFFKMEVEARVIAAALDHMNLTTMNDKPSISRRLLSSPGKCKASVCEQASELQTCCKLRTADLQQVVNCRLAANCQLHIKQKSFKNTGNKYIVLFYRSYS